MFILPAFSLLENHDTLVFMGSEISDEDLMLAYAKGDAEAFETLYVRHKGAVYRYLMRMCNNAAICDELFQDVWLKLIKSRSSYSIQARFTTWLYTLAHNHFIDYYRKHKKTNTTSEHEIDEITARAEQEPEQVAARNQSVNKLIQLIELLPEEQKQAFLLKEEAGMSVLEIADVMNVNQETAKSRLRYAMKKLREGLQDE